LRKVILQLRAGEAMHRASHPEAAAASFACTPNGKKSMP
jgi:hypothetical protein